MRAAALVIIFFLSMRILIGYDIAGMQHRHPRCLPVI
jgi:hypothetical protein